MNVNQLLAKLDAETIDSSNAPDKRRVLNQEAQSLRAATQSGDAARIGAAKREAERVLEMWQAVPDEPEDGCDGYRIFRGSESGQLSANGTKLDPHSWYFEPDDYEGDVVFAEGFPTRAEAVRGARDHSQQEDDAEADANHAALDSINLGTKSTVAIKS